MRVGALNDGERVTPTNFENKIIYILDILYWLFICNIFDSE